MARCSPDRCTPLPTPLVAIEKLVVAVLRGVVAGLLMFPIGALVLGHAPWRVAGLPLLLLVGTGVKGFLRRAID
jgi:hypothetical protein